MIRTNSLKKFILLLGDIAILYAVLFLVVMGRYYGTPDQNILFFHLVPFTILFALWLGVFAALQLYDLRFLINSKHFLYRLLRAMATNAVIAIAFLYLLPFWEIEPRRNLLLIIAGATLLLFFWRFLFNLVVIRTRAHHVFFLGITREIEEFAAYLQKNPQLGHRPVGFLVTAAETPLPLGGFPHYRIDDNLASVVRETDADTIVISSEIKEDKTLVRLLFQVIPLGIAIIEFPQFHELLTGKIPASLIREIWFVENLIGIRKQYYEFVKRAIDITLAVALALPSLILFPLIALAVSLNSVGPIFYRQKRIGRHGIIFEIIKYRSMVKDADKIGGLKEHGAGPDPRVTRVGLFLRKSYLDELPQIWNIFKGEMSFVGPRPERPEFVEKLKQHIPFYEMRLLVTPGISGWAQINMENDASVEDAPEKLQYDLYYIKNRSPLLDLLIMLRTFFIVLRREGR